MPPPKRLCPLCRHLRPGVFHNGRPLVEDYVCQLCNDSLVVPARLLLILDGARLDVEEAEAQAAAHPADRAISVSAGRSPADGGAR